MDGVADWSWYGRGSNGTLAGEFEPLYPADIDSIIIGGGARWNYPASKAAQGNTMWYAGFQLEEVGPTTTTPSTFKPPGTGGSQVYLDYYKIEEMGTIEPLTGKPSYLNETSRLSTKSAAIQDNAYYQQYAYDIRSKQDFKDYTSVIEKAVHPAGFKRYGTKLSEAYRRTSDSIDLVATNLANLTSFEIESAVQPAWSPDGTKIAFRSTKDSANGDIYYMDADGTNVVRVTNDQPATGNNHYPDWSPDGTELVFESRTDGSANGDIYAIKIGGTGLRRLTTNTYFWDTDPTFSPDGKKIAFQRSVGVGAAAGIMVMDASDGGNKNLLTPMYPYENSPSWSPDGKKIAYRKHLGTRH